MFFLLQKGGSGDNVLAETFFLIDQQKFFLAFIELLKGVTKPGAEEMVFFLLQGESALLPKKKTPLSYLEALSTLGMLSQLRRKQSHCKLISQPKWMLSLHGNLRSERNCRAWGESCSHVALVIATSEAMWHVLLEHILLQHNITCYTAHAQMYIRAHLHIHITHISPLGGGHH